MKNILLIILFFPMALSAQKADTVKILNAEKIHLEKEMKGWVFLFRNWKYKVGDNPEWAKPGMNDSDWKLSDLNKIPYDSVQIPGSTITWLRIRIKNDSSFAQPLVMRLYQTGASEIYLDGKLIHRFGIISTNADSAIFYNPGLNNFSFPLINDSTQLLAVRFLNMPIKYPLFFNQFTAGFYPRLAQFNNAEGDYQTTQYYSDVSNLKIVFGASILLGVLFLSLFIFFRAQNVNLFFSMCTFSLAATIAVMSSSRNAHNHFFSFYLLWTLFAASYTILLQLCIYKVFNGAKKWQYWITLTLTLLSIPGALIINSNYFTLVVALLVVADAFRLSTKKSGNNKSSGARILQVCLLLNLLYWLFVLFNIFAIIDYPVVYEYQPFAFLLVPIGLAMYIGYSFGTTSQSLQQKLNEVEQLSAEKQQILAIQNETLEKQVTERTAALNQSLEELKSTQQQLIQSEKMASLGELTAGIAHEIQNPLNFVNNFSEVNTELIEELVEEVDKGNTEEIKAIAKDIKENEEKINHHGKRADAIVKGMLQHSKSSNGIKELTDINALCDEYIRLSYHGLRAKDKSFNATIKTDFDNSIGKINIIPQDIGRVIMNLLTNAFYAVNEKNKLNIPGYEPTVTIRTNCSPLLLADPDKVGRKVGGEVHITVTDNGNGIPQNIVEKIFQPFFTTKPTGQGTGLGLSLSYDIITKGHGGEIKVETKEAEARPDDLVGRGTTFTILLPITA
ncbi:MAG: ATP-binding protein [Ferruginibacter sp.]